ncbi:hypothetical protein ACV35T_30835, partial [Pseudomonas aeruginosa]
AEAGHPVAQREHRGDIEHHRQGAELFAQHWRPTLLGALAMVVCYALFYISTVFSLSYGVASLGFSREEFLGLLCLAVLFMAAATPLSAWLSDRFGRKPVLL